MTKHENDWQQGLTPRQRMTRQIINSVRATAQNENLQGQQLISTIESTIALFFRDMPPAIAQRSEEVKNEILVKFGITLQGPDALVEPTDNHRRAHHRRPNHRYPQEDD